jgi:hypothetical protein
MLCYGPKAAVRRICELAVEAHSAAGDATASRAGRLHESPPLEAKEEGFLGKFSIRAWF